MLNIIKDLYKFGATLLGAGYDNALEWINQLIGLEVIEIPSGTQVGTWTVPDEWVIRDAWVKFNGEKILDYKKDPMCVMTYSEPIHGVVNLKEFKEHLYTAVEQPTAFPYEYSFYEKKWGFCMPKNGIYERIDKELCTSGMFPSLKKIDSEIDGIKIDPTAIAEYRDIIQEGDYEVFIDSEFKPGKMKIGVHTIPGKSKREILLFAHLDHPYQANDNLSGVACLVDLAKRLKCDHTVKIIFCPETIGSIAYALTQDISKVDLVLAVDICGNDAELLVQKYYDREHRINFIARYAITEGGKDFRFSDFRRLLGSDEYAFNDPSIGIPALLLSTFPYPEYHTSLDTPEIIKEEKIKETQDTIKSIIRIFEQDFIPVRNFKGPLMQSKYGFHDKNKALNRDLDYLIFMIDGKKYLSEIIKDLHLSFEYGYNVLTTLEKHGYIKRADDSKVGKQKTERKKHKKNKRKADVPVERGEVS